MNHHKAPIPGELAGGEQHQFQLVLPIVGVLLLVSNWANAFERADLPPNIIYILADDLGYGDLGSYGQQHIRTTRIDQLAREGLRFTQHYAGGPMCHPSRCVLFTGLHTGHSRIRGNSKLPLHPEDYTISQMFRQAGYATGGIGKWALGDVGTAGAPWEKGMDEFFGYLDQTHAHTYYPDHIWLNGERFEIPGNSHGARTVYSHDLFADRALDFIRRHRQQPFFFYAAFTIPHAEVTVPEDSLAEYQGRWPEPNPFLGSRTYCPQDQPRAVRAAMISRMDRDVGRIIDLLKELNLAEQTLVIFTSDNGPITAGGQDPKFFNSAGPLRGLKFSLYEGGIRVPMIAWWPGRIAAGTESPLVSDFADMFPTFAEVIKAPTPDGLDGRSILPTLLGQPEQQQPRELFYWESAPQQALRHGDWKLYRRTQSAPFELYNLAEDIGEQTNLAAQRPQQVEHLQQLMHQSRTNNPNFPLVKRTSQ